MAFVAGKNLVPNPAAGITALEIGTCLSYKAPYTWGMTEGGQPSKRALRAELRERRRIMTTLERSAAAEGLFTQLVELIKRFDAARIACYLSTGDEPTTRAFLDWAHQHNITAILPVSREDGLMDWVPYAPGSESLDAAGMPAPVGETLGPIALAEVDIIFVPAAGVSREGMRLGWGRGYYDRALGSLNNAAPVYAVVYDHEVLEEVPSEPHDQPVDAVVTPTRSMSCDGSAL
jgi:5-formyltetrahydrofolate cyclo-ligase